MRHVRLLTAMFALLALAAVTTTTAQAAIVELKTADYNGNRYILVDDDTNGNGIAWTAAESYAQATYGAHLTTVNDAAENAWIVSQFRDWDGDNSTNGVLIGLNDVALEGTFVWVDGDPSMYRNWNSGEPNDYGSGEDFVSMLRTTNGLWNDIPDTLSWNAPYYGLIEMAIAPEIIPEPTTFLVWFLLAALGIGCGAYRRKR